MSCILQMFVIIKITRKRKQRPQSLQHRPHDVTTIGVRGVRLLVKFQLDWYMYILYIVLPSVRSQWRRSVKHIRRQKARAGTGEGTVSRGPLPPRGSGVASRKIKKMFSQNAAFCFVFGKKC